MHSPRYRLRGTLSLGGFCRWRGALRRGQRSPYLSVVWVWARGTRSRSLGMEAFSCQMFWVTARPRQSLFLRWPLAHCPRLKPLSLCLASVTLIKFRRLCEVGLLNQCSLGPLTEGAFDYPVRGWRERRIFHPVPPKLRGCQDGHAIILFLN
jgi:hypothetical protein